MKILLLNKKNEKEKINYLDFPFTFENYFEKVKLNCSELRCPGGEIGRRTAFRWQRPQGCAGSNPVPGTQQPL